MGASRALPERGPFPHGPDCEVPDRLSQERHVAGNQQEPERQHPDAEHRQKRENPTNNAKRAHRDANPSSIGVTQTSNNARPADGDLSFAT
jgi:hypothetical protein